MNGGAVAYLTQSVYGRAGTEITINNYCTSSQSSYKEAVTGLAGNDVLASDTSSLTSVYAYNTQNGMKASTTGNVTGIYDLSGGTWERVASYILNGNININDMGNLGSSGELMGATSETNPNGYQTLSARDHTVYPYDSSIDSNLNNYSAYKGLLTGTYGYGDSILETSNQSGSYYAWNLDYSHFAHTNTPFFIRGRQFW